MGMCTGAESGAVVQLMCNMWAHSGYDKISYAQP